MSKPIRTFTFAAAASLSLGSAALAHPALRASVPAADAAGPTPTRQGDLKQLRLKFSEDVMAKFSGVDLKDKDDRTVSTGAPTTDAADSTQLVVPLSAPLAPGRYTVNWHAVSEDTHRVKGAYSFTVAP